MGQVFLNLANYRQMIGFVSAGTEREQCVYLGRQNWIGTHGKGQNIVEEHRKG